MSAAMTWGCWGAVVALIGLGVARDVRKSHRVQRETRPLLLVGGRDQPSVEPRPAIARTEEELERLANVPCAPDPRRLA